MGEMCTVPGRIARWAVGSLSLSPETPPSRRNNSAMCSGRVMSEFPITSRASAWTTRTAWAGHMRSAASIALILLTAVRRLRSWIACLTVREPDNRSSPRPALSWSLLLDQEEFVAVGVGEPGRPLSPGHHLRRLREGHAALGQRLVCLVDIAGDQGDTGVATRFAAI